MYLISRLIQLNGRYDMWLDNTEKLPPHPQPYPYPSSLTNITPSSGLKIISELFLLCLEIVGRGDEELQNTTFKMQICYLGKSWASIVFCYHSSRKQAFEWMRLGWGRRQGKVMERWGLAFLSVVQGPRARAPPGSLLERKNLGLHPRTVV